MTDINVPQNTPSEPHPEHAQSTEIYYMIKLTAKEWLKHWELFWAASGMAHFLRMLSESLLVDSPHHECARYLIECWFERETLLKSIYEKASTVVVERNSV